MACIDQSLTKTGTSSGDFCVRQMAQLTTPRSSACVVMRIQLHDVGPHDGRRRGMLEDLQSATGWDCRVQVYQVSSMLTGTFYSCMA